jgi:hypothetical protein
LRRLRLSCFLLGYFEGNKRYKNIIQGLLLGIICLNFIIITIQTQDDSFLESDDIITQLLKGFGLEKKEKQSYHVIPKLSKDNFQDSNSASFNNRFRLSSYYTPGWADTRFSFRKNITINAISANLTNFPVLVDLYDPDLQNDAQTSGNDIFFTNASGHILDHEIELYQRIYNSSHAHLVAWVKVNLSSTQDTLISMYYGNPAINNQENPAGVWSNGYQAVYHLSEDPTGTVYDSTANNNDGTSSGSMTSSDQTQGIFDGSIDFDGSDDLLNVGDVNSNSWPGITVQSWIYHDVTGDDRIICKSPTTVTSDHIFSLAVFTEGSDDKLRIRLSTDGAGGSPAGPQRDSAANFTTSTWHHLAFTWDSTSERIYLYIDGSQDINSFFKDGDSIMDSALPVILANVNTGSSNRYYDGKIDEARISNVARSSDWLNTEYNNQNNPNSFYSIGGVESSPDFWAYNSYKFRKKITIDAAKVTADLNNFPVLIDLYDTDLNDSAKVQADGDDIIFTSVSGVKLDHEIEFFEQTHNATHAHLVAWVRVPILSATDDTDLILYYGNKAAVSKENPEGVWDSNYMIVQHLQETDIDGGSGDIEDSSSGNNDGTTIGMDTSDQVDGKIDGSLEFDGVNDNIATEENNMMAGLSSFTISAWIKPQTSQSDFCGIVEFDNTTDGNSFDVAMELRSTRVPRVNVWTTSGFDYLDSSTVLPTTSFTYFVFVYNGNLTIYLDGSFDGSTTHSGNIRNNYRYLNIGRNTHDGRSFNGLIDEVRISNVVRSLEWIQTEYNNQNDPDSFLSVGSEEVNSKQWVDGSFRYRKIITINSSKVSEDLTNFPFLIDLTDSDLKSGRVQPDADDIIFIDQTGAKLDHEIELFQQNSSHGRLIGWVRIPSLSSVSDTNITMYYGNSAVTSQENVNGVWIDYAGIWHLSETSGSALDSTSYGEDGTIIGTDVTQGVTGIIDGAYNFGSGDGRVDVSDPVDGHLDFGTGNFTISFWLKSKYSSEYQRAVFKGAQSDGIAGYGFYRRGSETATVLAVSDNTFRYKAPTTTISDDVWTYIVGVVDRSTNEFIGYYNAIPTSPEDISALGSMDGSTILSFGRAGNEINGSLDEVRLSNSYHSLGWIQTEYNNQYNPTSFISVTSEETHPYWWADASFGKRKDIAIDKDKISADLSNFPVLIDIYDSDLRTDVQSDAADLIFTDSFNRKLDHEIELFDQTGNGTHAHLVAWVNVPILFNNSDTLISMYYGNNKLLSQENSVGVWNEYVGVWHLAEASGNAKDSTAYDTDGVATSMTYQQSGVIGYGMEWTSSSAALDMGDPADGHLDFGTGGFTLSIWVKVDQDIGWEWVVSKGAQFSSDIGYGLISDDTPVSTWRAIARDPTLVEASPSAFSLGEWNYIVCKLDRITDLLYIFGNGTQDASADASGLGNLDNSKSLRLPMSSSYYFDGWVDEFRLTNLARSADWILTEYNNQHDPTTFYDVGSEYELDNTPPVINNFGVDDSGTGTGTFWADITDAHSIVVSALIKIEGTEYSMSSNGTHWIKQLSVIFNGNYEYQIVNATDQFGNYLASPSSNKSHTFDLDTVTPDVLDWVYITSNNTFQANVTDSWGEIDIVIVNVTESNGVPRNDLLNMMVQSSTFGTSILAYMNDTLVMDNGPIKFQILVNDSSGNEFQSTTHLGNVYNNTPPVASAVTLSRDEFVEKLPIFSNSTLYLDYTFYDEEGHNDMGTKIWWYKDSGTGFTLQTDKNDSKTINGPFAKGDQWYATVEPHDSAGGIGDQVNSTTITIQNTPPQASNVQISPINPTTVSTLNISYLYSDPYDGDPQNIALRILEWYRNGSYIPTFDNQSSISAQNTTKGETWYYRIRVHDGTNYSSWIPSSTVVIGNSPPIAENLTITTAPTTTDDLTIGWDYIDLDNDDEITNAAIIEWWETGIGHIIGFDNITTLPAINTSKGQTWYYKLKVYDGTNYSAWITLPSQDWVTILNSAPVAQNATFTNLATTSSEDLVATWDYSDADGDSELVASALITWYKNGVHQTDYDNFQTISFTVLTKGDVWNYTLKVYDGQNYSILVASSQITIQNTSPTAQSASFVDLNTTSSENLVASWGYSDYDGDSQIIALVNITWYKFGVYNSSYDNITTIPAAALKKNDEWNYILQVYDGTNYSSPINSSIIIIQNSPPTVTSISFDDLTPTTTVVLNATWSYLDSDGDAENRTAAKLEWYRNGIHLPDFDNETLIPAVNTSKNQNWFYKLWVYDGSIYSEVYTSTTIIILNSIPIAQNITFSNLLTTSSEELVATWDYSDADGDIEIISYAKITWYKNGIYQSNYDDETMIPASVLTKGDIWNYTIRVFDGEDYSTLVESVQITIRNTPPVIPVQPGFTSPSPTSSDDLVASWDYSDYDGDTQNVGLVNITWYKAGIYNATYNNYTTLSAAVLKKGDVWNYIIQVYDGMNYSSAVNSSLTTIFNSPPTVTNPTFNDTTVDTNDDFMIDYQYADIDNDGEDQNNRFVFWFVNGQYDSNYDNKTIIYALNTTSGEFWYYKIRVYDGFTLSENYTSSPISIGSVSNTPPTASNLNINLTPTSNMSLIASYDYSDPENHLEAGTEIRWYRDNGGGFQLQQEFNDELTIPASATVKNDQWYFTVKPKDGLDFGSLQNSSELLGIVIVGNTPPKAETPSFLDLTVISSQDLIAQWGYYDYDNDNQNISLVNITWYKFGVYNASYDNYTTLSANVIKKGDMWNYILQVFDGMNYSSSVNSSVITILNTLPEITSLGFEDTTPTTMVPLNATWSYWDYDGDTEDKPAAILEWYRNGIHLPNFDNTTLVPAVNTSKNENWYYYLWVFDGENYSIFFKSNAIQILNSKPIASSPTFQDLTTISSEDLVAVWGYSDDDGDPQLVSYAEITWYKNGIYQTDCDNLQTISFTKLTKGDVWNYTLKVYDGQNYSTLVESSQITIRNTPPTAQSASFVDLTTTSSENLIASWDYADYDGDSQNVGLVNITWYKFGVYNASYDNYTTLSASVLKKGDMWNYILQVFDGMNYSLPVNSSIITILNTLPEITSLGFEDATPTTMVPLNATWSYTDYDGDTEDKPAAILEWYRNGIYIPGFDNATLIPAVNTSKNQFWFYKLWVYDGTDYSLVSSSESIQIINTAPIVISLPLPTNVTRLNGLILSEELFVSAFHDDDGDSVEIAEIYWYKDTILQGKLNGSFTIQGNLLTKGENWTYAIRPYDGTSLGLIYTSTNITVSNTAPSVISAVLSPSQAKTTDNLEVVINEVFDLDSDPLGPYSIVWYKGMVDLQAEFNNYTILPSANTTKGEIWRFEIRVFDGTNWSAPYPSNLITILNTKPVITNVTLSGGTSTYENLTLDYDFYDVDGDIESGTTITWRYTPGGTGGGYYGQIEINESETKAGQLWWVEILPNDGFLQGDLFNSLDYGITILIGNTAPTINQSDIAIKGEFNGTEYSDESFGTIFNLNLHYNATDIDGEEGVSSYGLNLVGGFALGSEYRWYRNRSGIVTLISVLNDQTTVPFYYTEKDDLWWVQVRPRDIYGDFGNAVNSTPISIGNSYPFVQGFSWLTPNPTMNDNLAFTFDYFDWDDDPINMSQTLVIIHIDETSGGTILKNGTIISVDLKYDIATNRYYYTITVSLAAGDYHKNDNISVIIRPFDGTNWASENYTSTIIKIINSLPLVTDLTLQPITNEGNLSLDWNYFDPDLDPQINENNIIIWYKNGIEQPDYGDMTAIPLGDISNGDLWRAELQVFDGSNYSVVYSVDIFTKQLSLVYNFDPQTSQVDPDWTLDSREFYVEDENIMISYHFSQEGDVIGWNIQWVVDLGNGTISDARDLYPDFPANTYTVPHQYTHPGEYWYCEITPFDGIYWWGTIQSREIYIQSRPSIHTDPQEVILALNDTEGHYNLTISATDLLNNIVAVEFTFNDTTIIASDGVQITDDIWTSELYLPEEAFESYLNSVLLGQIKVTTTVNYNDVSFSIYSILRFNITIEDTAAPRVLDAFFVPNEDVNPTNLTFYAHIQEFGAGVYEINLQYYLLTPGLMHK